MSLLLSVSRTVTVVRPSARLTYRRVWRFNAGQLRFGAPAQPLPVQGVQDATAYGSRCFQQGVGSMYPNATAALTAAQAGLTGSSEDCLFLNIFAPADRGEGLLPVMVWIHGGG